MKPAILLRTRLAGYDGHLLCHLLVCVEVECEARVVLLDYYARGTLDQLRADATLATTNERQHRGETQVMSAGVPHLEGLAADVKEVVRAVVANSEDRQEYSGRE